MARPKPTHLTNQQRPQQVNTKKIDKFDQHGPIPVHSARQTVAECRMQYVRLAKPSQPGASTKLYQ